LLNGITGRDFIGYSLESRIVIRAIFGVIVAGLAGLPRLFNLQFFSDCIGMVFSGAVVAFGLWVAECFLLPGTNAGFDLYHAVISLGIGSWIGLGMHIGTAWVPRRIEEFAVAFDDCVNPKQD
jgi:hypothetical protein